MKIDGISIHSEYLLLFTLRLTTNSFCKRISPVLLLLPLLLGGCKTSAEIKDGTLPALSAQKKTSKNNKPATDQDVTLYRQISTNFICIARQAEIDYLKALAVSTANFTALLEQKHNGYIKSVGDKQLTKKQIYFQSRIQLIEASIMACPDLVPEEEKVKFKNFLKQFKESNKK